MNDKYPIPANAIHDPNFVPITTKSAQFLRVDQYSRLYTVPNDSQGESKGECTDADGNGYIEYNSNAFTVLDSIDVPAGKTLNIYGLHAFGTLQAEVHLAISTGSTIIKNILVGGVSEDDRNWDPHFGGAAIEETAVNDQTISLLIKGVRTGKTGDGTGRIISRLL